MGGNDRWSNMLLLDHRGATVDLQDTIYINIIFPLKISDITFVVKDDNLFLKQ